MILFMALLAILVILVITTLVLVGAGGAAFILVFADWIVCIALIVLLIRWLYKRR